MHELAAGGARARVCDSGARCRIFLQSRGASKTKDGPGRARKRRARETKLKSRFSTRHGAACGSMAHDVARKALDESTIAVYFCRAARARLTAPTLVNNDDDDDDDDAANGERSFLHAAICAHRPSAKKKGNERRTSASREVKKNARAFWTRARACSQLSAVTRRRCRRRRRRRCRRRRRPSSLLIERAVRRRLQPTTKEKLAGTRRRWRRALPDERALIRRVSWSVARGGRMRAPSQIILSAAASWQAA